MPKKINNVNEKFRKSMLYKVNKSIRDLNGMIAREQLEDKIRKSEAEGILVNIEKSLQSILAVKGNTIKNG